MGHRKIFEIMGAYMIEKDEYDYFKKHGDSSGGPLNYLAMEVYLNAISNSIRISTLIKEYTPLTEEELAWLIDDHYYNPRNNLKSNKTLEMLSKQLYEAQTEIEIDAKGNLWGNKRFTLSTCQKWVWNLFVKNSFRGINIVEPLAMATLGGELGDDYKIIGATPHEDSEYRIDFWIVDAQSDEKLYGVQVKPNTYNRMTSYVKNTNLWRHKRIEQPVIYLNYYRDGDDISFRDEDLEYIVVMVNQGLNRSCN